MKLNEKPRRKYIIANLVYGANYPMLFLENQLKSLNDQTNLPAVKAAGYDVNCVLFTDEETLQGVSRHPHFMQLGQTCEINIVKLHWPSDADKFSSRYKLLVQMFHEVVKVALEQKADALSVWVADLVFAKHCIPKMLRRLEQGHDAVFNVPIRSAADSVMPVLQKLNGAPTDLELFELAYRNLHHLWTHSTWNNPYFSKFPYSMLWNSGSGLLAHNFGVTPIVFKPLPELVNVSGVIDSDVPSFFKNPFWAEDWTDAAVAGVEPLSNGHYPPFGGQANPEWIAEWARKGTQSVQALNIHKALYYPSKKTFNDPALSGEAYAKARMIQELLITKEEAVI